MSKSTINNTDSGLAVRTALNAMFAELYNGQTPVVVTQFAANTNNLVLGAGNIFLISSDAARDLSGIVSVTDKCLMIVNTGSFTITLKHQSTSSTSTNRFLCSAGSDVPLAPNESAFLFYDSGVSRWRVLTSAYIISGTAGKTLAFTNSLTLSGTDGTVLTLPPATASLGYLGVPQNSQSAAYTTVLADSAKCIFHPSSDNNARTFTIDSNANVAFPIGTVIQFLNMAAASVTIAITSDTLTLLPAGTTGSRTLAQYGFASAEKISSTAWIITGNSALT